MSFFVLECTVTLRDAPRRAQVYTIKSESNNSESNMIKKRHGIKHVSGECVPEIHETGEYSGPACAGDLNDDLEP